MIKTAVVCDFCKHDMTSEVDKSYLYLVGQKPCPGIKVVLRVAEDFDYSREQVCISCRDRLQQWICEFAFYREHNINLVFRAHNDLF